MERQTIDVGEFRHQVPGVQIVRHEVDTNEVKLIPLGDVHLGAPTCEIDKFIGTIDYIRDSGALVVLMGDLMECASRHSVGAGWVEQIATPQRQLDFLAEVLGPIASQTLVLLEGNHEFRVWRQTGIQIAKVLAKMLGVSYGGYSCFIKLKVMKQNYVIHAQHGSSNAWYPHTKLTAAMRTSNHTEADVFLYAHTHELLSLKVPKRYVDLRSRTVKREKKYYVLTGGFLGYEGSYAQRKNLYPTQTGMAKLKFFGDKWDIHITT